jgi:hypothetical protein
MAILDKNKLNNHYPFAQFAKIDKPLPDQLHTTWYSREELQKGTFFDFSSPLLGAYCNMTQIYLPFDQYDDNQYTTPDQIYDLVLKFLLWQVSLVQADERYYHREIFTDLYDYELETKIPPDWENEAKLTEFKNDMIETLHYLIGKMMEVAREGTCLVIRGY